jgi:outer membrane protein assembly factor BamB
MDQQLNGGTTMIRAILTCVLAVALCLSTGILWAGDWPQWRGSSGNARAIGFEAPKTWPKELTKKWKVTVGDGVSTPALVGDRLYVFSRQDDQEVLRCLNAGTGEEKRAQKERSTKISGPSSGFPGPRCSPAVGDGKVVTIGVHGDLVCYDADSGKPLWRKDEYKNSTPNFFAASSPLIVDKLCVAQLGGRSGALVAYDLATGTEKWKWTGDGTSYASPAVLTVNSDRAIVAETSGSLVAVSAADGKKLWETAYKTRYNASTPVTDGDLVIYSGSGKGTKAIKLEKKADALKATDVWDNSGYSVMYNTPVVKDNLIYGLTESNRLFCLDMKDGKKVWEQTLAAGGGGGGRPGRPGGGRMGGGGGYGSIVDAGSVLLALTPAGNLLVIEPGREYKELGKYAVGTKTYAYPVVSGKRIFIKDADSVTLWTVD